MLPIIYLHPRREVDVESPLQLFEFIFGRPEYLPALALQAAKLLSTLDHQLAHERLDGDGAIDATGRSARPGGSVAATGGCARRSPCRG